MAPTITPKALQPGATIAWVSPSLRINKEYASVMTRATAVLTGRGYTVRELFTQDSGIQNCISNRLSELRTAFSDPTISAVFCTIGGSTFTELLPALIADTELHEIIKANPKIVVGFSDITGLHWFLYALTGLRTFYGPGAISEFGELRSYDEENAPVRFCAEQLFRVIENPAPVGDIARSSMYAPGPSPFIGNPNSSELHKLAPTPAWTWLRSGKAEGRLFGGCLTVVARLAGVRAIVPDWRGRIVFIETSLGEDEVSGNPIYRVEAGIADLIAQGVFEEAAGLVVGRPFGYDTPDMIKQYTDVVTGLLCEGRLADKKFPILFGVDIGHTTPMVTLPFDALAVLDSENDRFAVLEAGVI